MKIILSLLLITSTAFAQYKNVKISSGSAFGGPSEPSITFSQTEPNVLVGGAILNEVFLSADTGHTWETIQLKSKYGVYGDPCIISDANGDFYYFHLSDPEGKGWASTQLLDRIVVQRSKNNGKRWSKGASIGLDHPKDQDKEWAIADPSTGNIYCTWTQFDLYDSKQAGDSSIILFSSSSNKGKSWSEPVRINDQAGLCLDNDSTAEGAVPAVGPNGEIYVAWSFDEKIYFNRSKNQGKTWLPKNKIVARQPGGWTQDIPGINRCNGLPVTLCDISGGANNGTIYINWTDQRRGANNTDVFVAKSTDGGETFSDPIKVNSDDGEAQQFFTWMTIDQSTGHLYAVFYDRRNYNDNRTDVYLATSSDGGETWTDEKISEEAFTPEDWVFFGDYTNITASNGKVRPIWTRYDADKKELSIYTAIINK